MDMTYGTVKNMYLAKGYKFRMEKMALNIHATRSKNSISDKFDDLGGVAWIDEQGKPNLFNFWITTDPGKHWLKTPMDKKGCIIMVPGQYLDAYAEGLHCGKYDCFKQVKEMCYVRDYNKDVTLDFDLYRNPEKRKIYQFCGIYGTNLHRGNKSGITSLIGPYSAGCQVVQRAETFDKLIALRNKSKEFGFKTWDYTLFEE